MATITLPSYVEHGGEAVFRHPFWARGVRNYAFFLEGDLKSLTDTLTRHFAEPTGGEVEIRPAASQVLLSVVHIDAIKPSEPPHSQISAGSPELELTFWVMGHDVRRDRPVYFAPYLFVDSGAAMAGGREAFGFPKQHGVFTLGGQVPPDRLSLDVLSVSRFDPAVPVTLNRLLDIDRREHALLTSSWSSLSAAMSDLAAVITSRMSNLAALTLLASSGALAASDRFPMVFLKQFRDIAAPERACYQAVTEAELEITNFRGGGLLDDYVITLQDLASEPIRRDLGLPSGALKPIAGLWKSYDFVLGRGAELWRAPSS